MKYNYIDAIYVTIKEGVINCDNYFVPSLMTTLYDYVKKNIKFKFDGIERAYLIDKASRKKYEIGVDNLPLYQNNWKGYITLNPFTIHKSDLYACLCELNHDSRNNKKVMWKIICENYDTSFLSLPEYARHLKTYNTLKNKYDKLLRKIETYHRYKTTKKPVIFEKIIQRDKFFQTLYYNPNLDVKKFLLNEQ